MSGMIFSFETYENYMSDLLYLKLGHNDMLFSYDSYDTWY